MNIQGGQSVSDKCPQRNKHQLTRSIGQEATTPITGSNLSSGQTDLWCKTEHGGLSVGGGAGARWVKETHTHVKRLTVRLTPLFSYTHQ